MMIVTMPRVGIFQEAPAQLFPAGAKEALARPAMHEAAEQKLAGAARHR